MTEHDDGRVLDPRSGCLVLAATAVQTLGVFLGACFVLFACSGLACDGGCVNTGNPVLALAFPGASAVAAGGALATGVRGRWRWMLLGTAFAVAMLVVALAYGRPRSA
jgi:hypothetical protein